MDPTPLHHISPQARLPVETLLVGIVIEQCRCKCVHAFLMFSMLNVGLVSDNVYHSEDDPPPFHENQDFDFGFDNKSIRRAFIRKVKTLHTRR